MNNKISLLIITMMLLTLAGMVSAGTCTVSSPAASASLTGNALFNITTTAAVKNCTITASSALSGDTWTVGTAINFTSGATNTSNATFTSVGQADAADWSFSVTCVNNSGSTIDTCTRSGITIDNGVPAIRSCTLNSATASNTTVGKSSASVSCTVANATSCSVYWLGATNAMAADTSYTDCSYTATSAYFAGSAATCTLSGIKDNYQQWYYVCSDGTNSTTGTGYQLKAEGGQISTGRIITPTEIKLQQADVRNRNLIWIIALVIGGGILAILAMSMTMKKRR